MTDRELLEAAAEADGHPYPWVLPARDGERPWNPLTDDGDALRLAVDLGLTINPYTEVLFVSRDMDEEVIALKWGADRNEDTRRAIVRAAAALGGTKGAT